ncbi:MULTISPECIES: phytanoyl-CoA dioxygenase family protein [Streptomyces]|uniref:Phytanoyl-CoA dioxygenase family protein n=1 Tax=Streptomyces evansiae TaxID=3075535 RepID=A0ABU2QUS5_9ACTN|nr:MULTISPECIES: phytanoyl-CoA dioxygenase family protein [unclassified Streptomyces]MDT0407797.1 phytanoyl-CoA dioxygenase family protein [Streptomyces sp. DSM 41979]MYQ60881.1 phytanoyl-CoA dioxygenase [Streptomyces sp. SID4926]SCE19721.1 Phytanoyl-CoA dioxygenase (PhyH) [Streptomyces sp. DfronAA-171]
MPVSWSTDELRRFVEDGVLIRRGLVHGSVLARARALVGKWRNEAYDPERLTAYTERSFSPELEEHPALLDLYQKTGLAELAAELLWPAAAAPVARAQIQIRLPHGAAQPVKAMHVDGVSCPHLESRDLRTFSFIVGAVLDGSATADAGALHYVPGGHRRMAEYFATDWTLGQPAQTPEDIDDLDGTALVAEPGDVIVMHHLVPHRVGINTSGTPRVMAYFRVSHAQHADLALEALSDPWLEFPALSALADPRPVVKGEHHGRSRS